jgi:hypothetical protein
MATDLKVFYRNTAGTFNGSNPNKILINNIVISNTSGSQQTYSISINSVSLTTSAIIPANDTVVLDLKQVVDPNQAITCSGTSCSFHFSGVEISA